MTGVPRAIPLLLALASACASADPCEDFCEVVASRTGECLAAGDLAWSATAWSDQEDLRGSCSAWAWEWRLLEADAGRRGATDAWCSEQEPILAGATCDQVLAFDWEAAPWGG
jgi:hypothetical protein